MLRSPLWRRGQGEWPSRGAQCSAVVLATTGNLPPLPVEEDHSSLRLNTRRSPLSLVYARGSRRPRSMGRRAPDPEAIRACWWVRVAEAGLFAYARGSAAV
jgi:hypothetical protein